MTLNRYKHTPVLLNETIKILEIKPDGTYLDCTFGRGGHSRKILEKLNDNGRLIAIDRDKEAVIDGKKIKDKRFEIERGNFSSMVEILKKKEYLN